MRTPGRIRNLFRDDPVLALIRDAAALSGVEALLVGGYLRDRITGRPARDCDFLIRGDAKPLLDRIVQRATGKVTFRKAGVTNHRLMFGDARCDFVTMSRRRPVIEELRRRDFTINTLVLDLRSEEFTDPLGGLRDLRAGRIRDVGPGAFGADPLRILRGIRIACDLPGFRIMPAPAQGFAGFRWSGSATSSTGFCCPGTAPGASWNSGNWESCSGCCRNWSRWPRPGRPGAAPYSITACWSSSTPGGGGGSGGASIFAAT